MPWTSAVSGPNGSSRVVCCGCRAAWSPAGFCRSTPVRVERWRLSLRADPRTSNPYRIIRPEPPPVAAPAGVMPCPVVARSSSSRRSASRCWRAAEAGAPASAPAEPPPPPIETELAPGSRLVEPRVQELVRQMSDRLAQVTALALEAEEVYDEVPADAPAAAAHERAPRRHAPPRSPRRRRRRATRMNRVVLVRRQDVLGPRPGTERLGERRRAADGRRGARLGVRPDRHRRAARRLPVRRRLRPPDGRRCSAACTWASTRPPACPATTCRSSRRRSTGSCGSTPAPTRCRASW